MQPRMLTLTLKQQLASNSHYYALRCTSANVVSVVFQVIYGEEITYTFSWLKWPTEIDDFEYRHWRKQVAQHSRRYFKIEFRTVVIRHWRILKFCAEYLHMTPWCDRAFNASVGGLFPQCRLLALFGHGRRGRRYPLSGV